MKFGQLLTVSFLVYIILGGTVFAQIVDIPDPNLRAAIADALNIPNDAPITQEDMRRLTHLSAYNKGIIDLSGLETATNLEILALGENPLANLFPLALLPRLQHLIIPDCQLDDISPLSSLTRLVELNARNNSISDLSVLAQLTSLKYLDLSRCLIVDISPLSHLVSLTVLQLNHNQIVDVRPLSTLTSLYKLEIDHNIINDINPLSSLTRLETLFIHDNRIHDISVLARYTRLKELNARDNSISDLSALAHLTTLEHLDLSGCLIIDISPLSRLVNLQVLQLSHNQIVDVRPISTLASLNKLEIDHNRITDHSPLDSLSLNIFHYDQACEMPPLPLEPRLENRDYPSIFSPWAGLGYFPISNRPYSSDVENTARHDLWWDGGPAFDLYFVEGLNKFKISGDIDNAIRQRDELFALNPNMVVLVDVGMRAAPLDWFPEDWPYWIRDTEGNIFREPGGIHGLMDFTHPDVQDRIVQQAVAVSKCGLYDGIFFDYWSEVWPVLGGFRTMDDEQRARDTILQRIRAETRPNFLIIGNVNKEIIPRTAPYINGGFMETLLPYSNQSLDQRLSRVEDSLNWLDNNLRKPTINALEGTILPTELPDSLTNLRWMRAITTLSLTHSNDYVLFKSGGGHPHYWYDFWDANLGQPVGAKAQLYDEEIPGLYIREFTNGWAVYNHSEETQGIMLPELATGVASGVESMTHTLPNIDGEMYLRVKPKNPADVNGDGVVNILDLVVVAQAMGTDKFAADVNGDGVINVFDLVFVADQF